MPLQRRQTPGTIPAARSASLLFLAGVSVAAQYGAPRCLPQNSFALVVLAFLGCCGAAFSVAAIVSASRSDAALGYRFFVALAALATCIAAVIGLGLTALAFAWLTTGPVLD